MKVKVRQDNNNVWGFVEQYSAYSYGRKGYVELVTGINPDGDMVVPYVMRNGLFVPLEVVDKEIGVERYIKAKKPFYCRLQDGFIARVRVGLDCDTYAMVPDKSIFEVYTVDKRHLMDTVNGGELSLVRVSELNDSVNNLLVGTAKTILQYRGSREELLKSRM